jgi:hypothetical protein
VGSKRNRFVINGLPAKLGLHTSGHQQDIPETALWRAQNVVADLDGTAHKRPSLTQWGQTIKQPNSSADDSTVALLVDFLSGIGTLTETDASSGLITTSVTRGYLQYNVPVSSGSETMTHYQSGTSSSTKWGLRLSLQGINLPAYDLGTIANGLTIRAIAAAGTGKEFVLWSGGLYYKNASDDAYTLIDGTTLLGQGQWSTIEILCDDGGSTLVYVDDTLVATITSSLIKDVTLSSGALFEIAVRVEGTGDPNTQYNARVAMLQYNDVNVDAFAAQPISAITDFVYVTSAGSSNRVLVMAAGDYIYIDRMEKAWRPLHPKTRNNVFFATYQRTLVWSDNDGNKQANIWQWDGTNDPELLDEAPNFVLMTEHQGRLIGVDRDEPLLLQISGYGNPNRYIGPVGPEDDPFSLVLDAASIPIPAKRGDAITAVYGDYNGNAIIWTTSSVWRLLGTGVFSYALKNISQSVGCVNGSSIAGVGNDIMYGGFYGLASLQTTDQFGDIQAQTPSVAIQAMWQQGSRVPSRVNRHLLSRTRLASLRTRSLLYVHLPVDSENQIMVLNTASQQWYGPWDIESLAMATVEIESPLTEVVMHGGASGKIVYTDFANHADYGTTAYTSLWEYANLNGRSVDPNIVGQTKSWKTLRLFYYPRGNYDYTVRWYAAVDEAFGSATMNQGDGYPALSLDNELRLDVDPDAQVYSSHDLMIAEIDLDVRGIFLNWDLTDSELGSDFYLFGWQAEFELDGIEVE